MLKEEIKRELETVVKNVLGEDVVVYCDETSQYYNGSNEIQITFFIAPDLSTSKSFDWTHLIRNSIICVHYSIICEHDENNQVINQQVKHYITSMRDALKIDKKCTEEHSEEVKRTLALYTKLIDSRDSLFDELAKVRYLDYIEED